jgi:hypothetical protein
MHFVLLHSALAREAAFLHRADFLLLCACISVPSVKLIAVSGIANRPVK